MTELYCSSQLVYTVLVYAVTNSAIFSYALVKLDLQKALIVGFAWTVLVLFSVPTIASAFAGSCV
jgi:hypothetical protein